MSDDGEMLYFTDQAAHIWSVNISRSSAVVEVLAGSVSGFADGNGTNAMFNGPLGLAMDADGTIIVADRLNYRLRRVTPSGNVTTIAGNGTSASTDGDVGSATMADPNGVMVDPLTGDIYFTQGIRNADSCVRMVSGGRVGLVAGDCNSYGTSDGNGSSATFNFPMNIAMDGSGSGMYVADLGSNRIRRVTYNGSVRTWAGNGSAGWLDGVGTNAMFNGPDGMARDGISGMIYIGEENNNRIRRMDVNGNVTTVVGNGTTGGHDGIGTNATLNGPRQIVIDETRRYLYVAEAGGRRIRRIVLD